MDEHIVRLRLKRKQSPTSYQKIIFGDHRLALIISNLSLTNSFFSLLQSNQRIR